MYASLRVILEEEQDLNIYPDPNKLVRKFDFIQERPVNADLALRSSEARKN